MSSTWKAGFLILLGAIALASPPCLAGRKQSGIYHTVSRGDTLWSISRTYGVPFDVLLDVNRIKNPDVILVGDILFVPASKSLKRPAGRSLSTGELRRAPKFIWPLKGQITSRFGPRRGRWHSGLDIAAPKGIIIVAAAKGRVVRVEGGRKRYGKVVLIDHGKGFITLYAHCSRIFVREGQKVKKRQAIAAVGATGNATGPHLHLEIWADSHAVNPELLLPNRREPIKLTRRVR